MKCCANHPTGCPVVGISSLVGTIGVGVTFGWRYVFLAFLIEAALDWLIRVAKHEPVK